MEPARARAWAVSRPARRMASISRWEAIDKAGITFDHVLSIEISDAEIEERMSGRGKPPGPAHGLNLPLGF